MDYRKAIVESLNVEMPETIRVDGIMNEGDFIIYNDGGEFVMYHQCDGLLWRTVSDSIRRMSADKSEMVEGIKLADTRLPVVKTGGNFGN
jgi:hypothetical protein